MPQDNASVIVKRDTKSVIDQTPKVNGQMLWTTDIGQDNHIYTDVIDSSDNTVKRIQIGGILPETETEIQGYVTSAQTSATNANNSATSASTSATNASNSATLAESYAKGGTNTRTGEDTDNAKYYKEQADVDATNASASATSAQTSATNASNSATLAGTNATNASNSATLSESYAKGGTGTRTGEDTDNAEYYKEQAKAYAESASQGVQPATSSTIGGVKPDNHTIVVDGVGTITAQEVQEITESDFNALVTKDPKVAYFVKSSTSGITGRIWYNDSWFGGSDITIDTVLDTTSNNPIANSAVATALAGKQNTLTTAQLDATNSGITSAKVSKLDALPTSTQLENIIDTSWHVSDHLYEGRDLTVVFASEIANYSDEWAWIQARLNNHNLRGIHVADYIPINVAEGGGAPAQIHKAEIAGINTYRRTGDGANEVGYHIDWITRDCYSVPVKWNTENNNNGNSSNGQPFLASNLKNWLDTVVYPRLETKLKNVIKPKRVLAPTRYQSGTTLTDDNSWAWSFFDKLWIPFESEVFDIPVWSTKEFGYGQAVQYPIFANSYEHRMKGAGPDGGRTFWWLASACSGYMIYAVGVSGSGGSYYIDASTEHLVPLCFRTMEG